MLNGFDGNGQQIVTQSDFFLKNRLGVRDAAEHAIKASHGINAGADFLVGREQVLARVLVAELRFVSQDRGELTFELLADIDHKCRLNIVIKGSVNNLERTVGSDRSADILPAVEGAFRP